MTDFTVACNRYIYIAIVTLRLSLCVKINIKLITTVFDEQSVHLGHM